MCPLFFHKETARHLKFLIMQHGKKSEIEKFLSTGRWPVFQALLGDLFKVLALSAVFFLVSGKPKNLSGRLFGWFCSEFLWWVSSGMFMGRPREPPKYWCEGWGQQPGCQTPQCAVVSWDCCRGEQKWALPCCLSAPLDWKGCKEGQHTNVTIASLKSLDVLLRCS